MSPMRSLWGGQLFLMSEVPLQGGCAQPTSERNLLPKPHF